MKEFKYKYNDCPDILKSEYQAMNIDVLVFRLVKNNYYEKNDFLPHCKVMKWWKKDCIDNASDLLKCCKGCGLSVFLEKSDAIKNYKQRPNLGKYIFKMIFSSNIGKLYITKTTKFPSHSTFFVYNNVDESKIFSLEEEIR